MYANLIEVDMASGVDMAAAVQNLEDNVIPKLREAGACAGFWLAGSGTRRVAIVVFETEEAANASALNLKVGETPPGAPEGITIRSVEVSEVVASL